MLRLAGTHRITRLGKTPRERTASAAKRAPMATELRPLGLGELLDRAVTLFVRRFSTIVTAIALTYVPYAVFQWATVGWLATPKTTLTRQEWKSFGLSLALGLLVYLLERTAVAALAHGAYVSRSISLGAAYGLAVRRFGAQVVTSIFAALIGVAVLIAGAIPIFAITFISGGTRGPVQIVIGIIVAGAVFVVLGSWLFLGWELASVRIATTAHVQFDVLFAALRAVLRRPWHALLVAATLLVVQLGGSLMLSALTQLMPSQGLRAFMTFGVGSAMVIVIEALTVTYLVVYDVDIAVRREGLDLTAALDAQRAAPFSAG